MLGLKRSTAPGIRTSSSFENRITGRCRNLALVIENKLLVLL